MPDKVECPWCPHFIDIDVAPISRERAEERIEEHKKRCVRRKSPSHPRDHTDVHGEGSFEDNSGV